MSAVELFDLQPEKQLYDVLMRATEEERDLYCAQGKFKAMCALLKYDRFLHNNAGDLALNKLGKSTFKVVLESFPDFTQGLALIEATHPAFIYTPEFKAYTQDFLEITESEQNGYTNKIYTLGDKTYTISYKRNILYSETWKTDGKLDRKVSPAIIIYHKNGQPKILQWYRNGESYRENNEAIYEKYYETGVIWQKSWGNGEIVHREDGPAIIRYNENGKVEEEEWYLNDKSFRRDGGPVLIRYHENGKIEEEVWLSKNGKYNRGDDLPASINYREDGTLYLRKWYKNDQFHRRNGPAMIEYDENEKVIEERWYLRDELRRKGGPVVVQYVDGVVVKEYATAEDFGQTIYDEELE